MIKAVLFDFDGTIVDSLKHIHPSWKQAFALQGVELSSEEIICNVFYASREERIKKYGVDGEKLHTDFGQALRSTLEFYEKSESIDIALQDLQKRNIQMAIVTSGNSQRAREILERLKLTSFFTVVLGGSDVEHGKPAPDIALKAVEILAVHPQETVLVGDSAVDIMTGKNAGVRTGLYASKNNTAYTDQSSFDGIKADFEFTHYSELVSKLGLS